MVASEYPTLTTVRLRPLLAVLRKRGVDIDGRLKEWGTDEATLLDPLHRMPREQVLGLLAHLGLVHEPGELGLDTADALETKDLDVMGHLLASAPTLGAALAAGTEFFPLIHEGVELELKLHGDEARVRHRISGGRVQLPPVADFGVAVLVRVCREIMGSEVPLSAVKLARPRPDNPARYRAWFGAPVTFEAECNEIRFAKSLLDRPLPRADASLHGVLERQARAMLVGLSVATVSPTFVERARLHVAAGLDRGEVTAEEVARRLRVAERTLRRRLEEANTSYRQLLDDVRRERALALAKDPRLSVSQIADQLGFSGATSFGRAFRRWTGVLPSQYARKERDE